jgi:hypothetical protein
MSQSSQHPLQVWVLTMQHVAEVEPESGAPPPQGLRAVLLGSHRGGCDDPSDCVQAQQPTRCAFIQGKDRVARACTCQLGVPGSLWMH